jgi:hypothetical protein
MHFTFAGYGGPNQTQAQKDNSLGGVGATEKQRSLYNPSDPGFVGYGRPDEAENQRKFRDKSYPKNVLFGGGNETEKQLNTHTRSHPDYVGFGPNETSKQKEGRSRGGKLGMAKMSTEVRLRGARNGELAGEKKSVWKMLTKITKEDRSRGGKHQKHKAHNVGEWYEATCSSGKDCVESKDGLGKKGRSKGGARPSRHFYPMDGKLKTCGTYTIAV